MMKTTLAALAITSSLAACHDRIIAIKEPGEVSKPGQMTVTGSATLEVSPDCADLTMTVSSDNLRPKLATAAVTKNELALVAKLTAVGVTPSDIKLSLVTLEPIYRVTPPIVLDTYRAQITITVTTHDFAKISSIMETGVDAGATAVSSQFRRSNLPELKKKVRDMALAAAKDKAKQTADALGITLGRVVSVGEAPAGAMWGSGYFPQAQSGMSSMSNMSSTLDLQAALGGTLQPLTLDVNVGYELAREI